MDPTEVVVNEPVTLNAGMPTECTRKCWMIKDIDPCMDRVARYRSNRHQIWHGPWSLLMCWNNQADQGRFQPRPSLSRWLAART